MSSLAKTRLSTDQIGELAAHFGLGEVLEWRPIAAGTINSNHELRTAAGRYFLRVNEGKADADVEYEAGLVEALRDAGVITPVPLRTRDGRAFAPLGARQVSVFPWLAGEHRSSATIEPADAAALGSALATLHLAGAPLAERFDRAGIYTADHIAARAASIAGSPDPELGPALAAIARELAELEQGAADRARAPRGIIHGDLFPDNVLMAPGKREVAALLDFEQASTGSLVYDLAVAANAWCFAADLVPARLSALLAGYQAVRPLGDRERALLGTELRLAALRFLVTRITDVYLPGVTLPGKDFRRYLLRLESWRRCDLAALLGWPAIP